MRMGDDWGVRQSATEALVKIGPPSIEPSLKALRDENGDVRKSAAEALGKIGDKRAIEPLIKALGDENGDVRESAAEVLGKIGDKRAVEPLLKALEDENEYSVVATATNAIANAIKSITANLEDLPILLRLTKVKKFDISLSSIERLAQVGDTTVVRRLQFIARNQFKHSKEERQAAKQSLEQIKQRVGQEEWEKATKKKPLNFKKYLKVAGIGFGGYILLWSLGALISYTYTRVRRIVIDRQQDKDKDKQTKLDSFTLIISAGIIESLSKFCKTNLDFIYIGLAVVGGVILFYAIYKLIKRQRTSPLERKPSLSFFRTIREIVSLRKDERVSRDKISRILRLGTKEKVGGGAILFLVSGFIVFLLIIFTFIHTYIEALMLLAGINTIGLLCQSDSGVKVAGRVIDLLRMGYRFSVYLVSYLRLVREYEYSSALNPEHFYLLRQFQKEQGERMFNEVRDLAKDRLGNEAQWQILNLIISTAYKMSKVGKDVRDLLEIQVPVAIEVSTSVADFKLNLGVVERILTGPYDIKLIGDKQRFKAFFEKVGKDLRPIDVEQTVETIGLLEHRLRQQGFNINHFYDEVFKGMDRQTLSGAMDIIFEIIRHGFFPTEQLINMVKTTQDRKQLYRDWQEVALQIRARNFNPTNSLHIELEYSTFRRIIDNSRIVAQHFKGFTYKEYIGFVKSSRKPEDVDKKVKAELIYAAYEALKVKEFIDEVKKKTDSLCREVWVIPNFSLGRFAAVFIEGDLRLEDVEIVFAKIGSGETHDNPHHVDPRFIRSQVLYRIVSERPVIIVIDSSKHLDRYPDAYQGYLNLAIAVNDVISNREVFGYADMVGRSRRFIQELKRKSDFKAIRETIQKTYDNTSKKDNSLYSFHFWNPRGKRLKIRSSWITRRGTMGKPEPLQVEDLKGPAFIFVNSVLTDQDLPPEIKEKAGNIEHSPGYFDDIDYLRIAHLFFKLDETGIHLADRLHDLEIQAVECLQPPVERKIIVSELKTGVIGDEIKLPNSKADSFSTAGDQSAIKIRRLIDELDDRNSKIRADAAQALGEFVGNETIAVALRRVLLKDTNKDVRYWVASSLGSLGVKDSVKDLSEVLLKDVSPDVRMEVARALGKLEDSQAIPPLSKALENDRSVEVRRKSIQALRNIGTPEVLPVLLKILKEDREPVIRAIAGEAYLDIGRKVAVPEALKCLNDKDEAVRVMLIEGLGDLGDELQEKRDEVVEVLSKLLPEDKSPRIREKVAWALGQIGDISAIDTIKKILKVERDNQVKEMLVWAFERFGKENPNIIQTDIKNLSATKMILEMVAEKLEHEIKSGSTTSDEDNSFTRQQAQEFPAEVEVVDFPKAKFKNRGRLFGGAKWAKERRN
jgi:HEAT repeat protein